ncbi:hypothetical protein [Rhodopirellula baltica]|uniref:hypothetical protein n=1 Tax=Rhodopirellula baltica TaxID=265606 RepID=UPI00030ADFD3|nr:hypothetical protein [Rhodopirellula baltica]
MRRQFYLAIAGGQISGHADRTLRRDKASLCAKASARVPGWDLAYGRAAIHRLDLGTRSGDIPSS